jgi:hypothetical protein
MPLGGFDIHGLLGKIPHPKKGWTLPNHKYTGPFNPLSEQLDEYDNPIPGQEPYNQVDDIARQHDICYRDHSSGKNACDRRMVAQLDRITPKSFREKVDRIFVRGIINSKQKLGVGY